LNGCTLSVLEDKTNGIATLSLVDTQTNDIVDSVSIWVPALYNEWGTTVTTGMVSMDMIEEINHDQKFYGREGVYIDKDDDVQIFNFSSEYRNDQDDKYPKGYYRITFDVYNSMPIVYGVRVYDENNSYIRGSTVLIQSYSANYSAWRITTGLLSNLGDDLVDGKMGYFTGEWDLENKVTNISLDVPIGGLIKFCEMKYEDDDGDGVNDNVDVRWANYGELMVRFISLPDVMAKLKIPKPSANGVVDMGTFVASLQTPMMKVHTEALVQDIIKSCAGKNTIQAIAIIEGLLMKAEYAECVEHIKQALQASIIEIPKTMGEELLNTAEDALLLAAKPLYVMTNAGDAGGNVAEIATLLKAISDVDDVEYLQMELIATPSSAK